MLEQHIGYFHFYSCFHWGSSFKFESEALATTTVVAEQFGYLDFYLLLDWYLHSWAFHIVTTVNANDKNFHQLASFDNNRSPIWRLFENSLL